MRPFYLLLIISINLSFYPGINKYKNHLSISFDSIIIRHDLDGKINEWPAQKFETDNESGIKYAVDNDAENLYAAVSIKSFPAQMKIMRQGMSFYIDTKGKKSEGKGIIYPVPNDNGAMPQANREQNQKFDKAAIRSSMVMNMIFLKLFGFNDGEPVKQSIDDGDVTIQFGWDSTDVMNIEYKLPLSMLGETALDQKLISLGWSINTFQGAMYSESKIVAVPSGRSPRGRNSSGNNSKTLGENSGGTTPQTYWTKYTISAPAK